MTTTITAEGVSTPVLPSAAWDIGTFLENATGTVQGWGGSLLVLAGCVGLIWGGVLLIMKLTASPQKEQQQAGWGKIALLMIVGGALFGAGFDLVRTVGSGGEQTILDLGEGSIYLQAWLTQLLH